MTKDRLFFFITALMAAIILTMLVNIARADQRTIYGSDGRVIAREATTPSGTTTLYGADGRVITRTQEPRHGEQGRNRGSDSRNDSLHKRGQ